MPSENSESESGHRPVESDDAEVPSAIFERFRTGLSALESGDFGSARPIFGELIEAFPNDPEYLCGYYAAGWWFNREERRSSLKEGRALGDWLMNEWDTFQNLAEQRNFTSNLAFRASMRAVLRDAAEQYRIAFQSEGASSVDTNLLKTLALCLIRLEDYANASEILLYARKRQAQGDPELYFLLGETLCNQEREDLREKGLSFYRDACLINVKAIDPGLIASEPATEVFAQLYEAFEHDLERTSEWFPAYLHTRCMAAAGLRRFSSAELEHLEAESQRLARDLQTVVDKFKDRVRATLAFYLLCLIHYFRVHAADRETAGVFEDRLKNNVPEVYTEFRDRLNAL